MDIKEKTINLDQIELEMKDQISEMKSEIDTLMADMHQSIRKQTEEIQKDIKWELEGIGNDDPNRELQTDVRELKKDFEQEISEMQEHMKNTMEILNDKMDIKFELLKDRSEVELTAAIGEIIQQARESDANVE